MINIDLIIKNISIYSVWIPFFAAILVARKGLPSKGYIYIILLITASLLSDIISIYLARKFGNNMPWFHFYNFFEGMLLCLYFNFLFKSNKWWKIAASSFLTFLLINSILIGSITTFNPRGWAASGMFFIITCCIYFYTIYSEEKMIAIEKDPHFWIVTALLIYYSGSFFTFLSYLTLKTWMFHNLANSVKNIVIAAAFILLYLSKRMKAAS